MAAAVPLPNSQGTLPHNPPWEPFFSDFLFQKSHGGFFISPPWMHPRLKRKIKK
jgi:hypothetical protein